MGRQRGRGGKAGEQARGNEMEREEARGELTGRGEVRKWGSEAGEGEWVVGKQETTGQEGGETSRGWGGGEARGERRGERGPADESRGMGRWGGGGERGERMSNRVEGRALYVNDYIMIWQGR